MNRIERSMNAKGTKCFIPPFGTPFDSKLWMNIEREYWLGLVGIATGKRIGSK